MDTGDIFYCRETRCLRNKGEHGLSVARIILELLSVVLVFLDSPDIHLASRHDVEKDS